MLANLELDGAWPRGHDFSRSRSRVTNNIQRIVRYESVGFRSDFLITANVPNKLIPLYKILIFGF